MIPALPLVGKILVDLGRPRRQRSRRHRRTPTPRRSGGAAKSGDDFARPSTTSSAPSAPARRRTRARQREKLSAKHHHSASWPGLTRPSTSSPWRVHSTASTKRRRMDGRVKPGHDGEGSVKWRGGSTERPTLGGPLLSALKTRGGATICEGMASAPIAPSVRITPRQSPRWRGSPSPRMRGRAARSPRTDRGSPCREGPRTIGCSRRSADHVGPSPAAGGQSDERRPPPQRRANDPRPPGSIRRRGQRPDPERQRAQRRHQDSSCANRKLNSTRKPQRREPPPKAP